MATVIGNVSNLESMVRAVTPVTQEVRTLTVGDPVFSGDLITTSEEASLLIEFSNGENLALGRNTQTILDSDVYPVASLDAGTEAVISDVAALQQIVLEGNFEELEEPAAGDYGALGSASEGGIQIARIASEGKVNAGGFSTVAHAQGITDVLTHRFDEIEDKLAKDAGNILTLDEDTSLSIDVTSSAKGLTGSDFTILITSQPTNGTVTINGDGSLTYRPNANFNGKDHFSYVISDGFGGTHEAEANLFVTAVDDDPIAQDDTATVDVNGTTTINVLANDSDPDGGALTVGEVTQPANGSISINDDGTIDYTPDADFSGTDSFTYTVVDESGVTQEATVEIVVAPESVNPDAVTLDETDSLLSTSGTLTSTDVNSAFTAATTIGANGTFTINESGAWTFTANSAFNSLEAGQSTSETFNVTTVNGTASTVTIQIDGTNDAATVSSDSVTLTETDAALSTSGTLTSTDIDNADNTFTADTIVGTNGTFAINAAGAWTFTANSAFDSLNVGTNVTETFNVTSVDGTASTVTIQINGTNDAETVSSDSVTLTETDAALSTSGTLTSTDVDNADSTFTANTIVGTNGTFSIDVAGAWTFTANSAFDSLSAGASITETFNVTSINGTPSTVTIQIDGTNDAPVISNDSVTTDENVAYTLTASDFGYSDVDGDALSAVTITQLPVSGEITLSGTPITVGQVIIAAHINAGNLVFTPAANDSTDVSFDFKATDGTAWSNTATTTITVNAVGGGSGNLSFSVSLDNYAATTATAATPGSVTDLGAGYGDETSVNIATNWGGGTYTTGSSNETITGGTGYTTIDSAGGDDNIIMTAANNLNIISGTGDDRVEMTGSYGGSNTITTGDGNDRIVDSSTGTRASMIIDTGAGHDYVDMAAGDNQVATLGSGNDEVIMGAGHNTIIDAGTGDDSVTVTGYGTALDITTGDGNDQVINASGTLDHSNSTFDTGAGDDSVQIMKGDNIQYNLGSGNDTIENLWAYTENIARGQLVDGGTGVDTLILNGNSYDYHVTDNGDGTYTVQPVHETFRYNDLTITNIENIQYLDKTISVGSDTSDGVFEYDMTLNAGSVVGTDTFSSITLTNVPAGVTITGATDNGDGTFTVPVDANADASITLVSTTALSSSDLNSMIGTITATSVDTSTQDISASLDVTVNVGVSATAPVVTMSISQATVAQGEINTSHADMGAGYGNQNTIDSMTYSTHAWDDRIVNGTDQNDTINVIQGLRQTVSSGDGDDLVITADNENISSLNLDTGAGNDRVVLGDGAQRINNVINTGTGDDRVEIANGLDNVWADNMVINTGAGDDYVEHSSGRAHQIDLGDGNDTYAKTQATNTGLNLGTIDYTETVEGGSANDILYDGNGDRLINSAPTVDGGQGVDTYIINGNSGDYRVTARADGTYEVAETMGNAWDTGRFSMLLVNMEHVQFNDTTVDLTPFTEQNYSYDVVLHTELTDTDGSETLSDITLGNVPAGVVVLEGGANQQHPDGAGNYILSPNGNGDITVTFISYTPLTTDELNAITASATVTETANGLTATTTVTAPIVYNEVAISDEAGITNGNLLDNVDAGSTLDSVVYNGTTYNAADYAGGLTINTLSGGTLVLDFTTGTYTSTGTGTDETFTVNATDSQSNAVSFTFDANDIAGGDADILYGDDLAAEQFNIETGHDTTIVDFDYTNDVLDLSEVITGPVDAGTLSNYLNFTFGATDTDGDGNMDVTSITVDADANAATVDDITVINLQDSQFDIDQIDDLKVDYQDN